MNNSFCRTALCVWHVLLAQFAIRPAKEIIFGILNYALQGFSARPLVIENEGMANQGIVPNLVDLMSASR